MDQNDGTNPGDESSGGNRVDKRCMKRLPYEGSKYHQPYAPRGFAEPRRATSTPYAHLWITLWTV
jgi:hypothetical protein